MSTVHSGWHVDDDLLDRYAEGAQMTPSLLSSVEAHLERCPTCQGRLAAGAPDPARLAAVWTAVTDAVDAPRQLWAERLLVRCGVAPTTARLVALTPSLRTGWLSAAALLLLLSLAVAHTGPVGVALFLALAPLLPVAGVAAAFGAHADPFHELTLSAPYSSFRLLLVRSAAVVGSSVLLSTPAAALLPGSPWLAVGWLLPALALTTTSLALAGRVDTLVSSVALAAVWLPVALSGLAPGRDPLLVARIGPQLLFLTLFLLAGAALLRQRRAPFVTGSPA